MSGIERIAAERRRQTERKGWTPKHDNDHHAEELARAAAAYALPRNYRPLLRGATAPPWFPEGWDFKTAPAFDLARPLGPGPIYERIHELEKAGALAAAEIDRLERRIERFTREGKKGYVDDPSSRAERER